MTAGIDHAAHDALRAETAQAEADVREAFTRMWRAGHEGDSAEYGRCVEAWQRANVRHSTLIEAGIIITLGAAEREHEDT